jgi:hypothetical protein
VPRKASRSNPDKTPAIWFWCFAMNCCRAFLYSFNQDVSCLDNPHLTETGAPHCSIVPAPRCGSQGEIAPTEAARVATRLSGSTIDDDGTRQVALPFDAEELRLLRARRGVSAE